MAIILFLGAIALTLWLFAVCQLETSTMWLVAAGLMLVSFLLQLVGPVFRLLGLVP